MKAKKWWPALSTVMIITAAVLSVVFYGLLLGSLFQDFSQNQKELSQTKNVEIEQGVLSFSNELFVIRTDRTCRM